MRNYEQPVFKIVYFENNDIVTASMTYNDNVAGAPDTWGDGWKGKED